MASKDSTASFLKRLEEGTAEIYSRYEKMISATQANYNRQIKALDSQYADAANAVSAGAKIDLKNTLEKMADAGYVRSGETVHATLSANAAKTGALSDLAVQKAQDRAELEGAAQAAETELSMQAQKEAGEYRQKLEEDFQEQENRDREYEAQQAQREFENRLATEKFRYQQEKDAKEAADKTSAASSSQEKGVVPERSAYDYLNDIVKRNTSYPKGKNYKVIDRKAILQAIHSVVNDTNLSYRYRYEFYLYAKSLGYLNS